jgi:hypothetical protein
MYPMTLTHNHQDPELAVTAGLLEAGNCALGRLDSDSVAVHTILGELALFGGEPPGVERVVGQHKDGGKGDHKGDNAYDDEEPLPAADSVLVK